MTAEIGNLTPRLDDADAPPPEDTVTRNTSGGGNNARKKQRANRRLKRQQQQAKQDEPAEEAAEKQEKRRHHRPSPSARSMIVFMKMHDWWQFFIDRAAWLSQPKSGPSLDGETAEAISRPVNECWPAQKQPPAFRSVADLQRLIEAKTKEVAYMEKQLRLMPSLRDPAWDAYCARLVSGAPADETLTGLVDFLQHTLVPHLKIQVQTLEARVARCEELLRKYEELRSGCERQVELRDLVWGLRQNQELIIPICPVWKEVQKEIELAEEERLDWNALAALKRDRDKVWAQYEAALKGVCGP
jgi:hypothetical protein